MEEKGCYVSTVCLKYFSLNERFLKEGTQKDSTLYVSVPACQGLASPRSGQVWVLKSSLVPE